MIPDDIRKKIRHIEIQTRRLLKGSLVGDSRSAIKGFGFDFDQIREYRSGDDVRFIDWKSSLRHDKILVKQYIEERNRRIILAVDVSGSSQYSSCTSLRYDINAYLASVLALVAGYGKDAVGLILFSDEVEYAIAPKRGRAHVKNLMYHALMHKAVRKKTNIASALNYIAHMSGPAGLVFLISDFIDQGFEKQLRGVAKKHEIVALCARDNREVALDNIGFLTVQDPETGQIVQLDTRGHAGKELTALLHAHQQGKHTLLKKHGIPLLELALDKPFMTDLITFFRRRMVY